MAIITDDFRRTSARHLENDIGSGDTAYYIGLGKSDPWFDNDDSEEGTAGFDGVPGPIASTLQIKEVLENLSFIGKVANSAAYSVIPRVNLGQHIYKVYDPADPDCFEYTGSNYPCYAMNSSRQLFICLRNTTGADAAVAMTSAEVSALVLSDTADPFAQHPDSDEDNGLFNPNGGDYIWAYVCTVDNNSGFYTNDYIAIENNDFTGDTAADSDTPVEVTGGMLYGFTVHNGGSGFTTAAVRVTCRLADGSTLALDSTSAASDDGITVTVSSGVVTAVEFDTTTIMHTRKLNVVYASVYVYDSVGSGTGAIVTARIAPPEGFGGNNKDLLPTFYTGIKAQFPDVLTVDGVTDGIVVGPYKFRQISLIKGPVLINTSPDTNDYADSLRSLTKTSGTDPVYGDIIFQDSQTSIDAALQNNVAVAYVDHVRDGKVYYHQNINDLQVNPKVNAAEFTSTGTVYINTSGSSFVYSAVNEAEYSPYTAVDASDAGFGAIKQNGKVIFVENREAVERSDNQTEEVRLVIQF